jgi:RND superfamily putative drug exporter
VASWIVVLAVAIGLMGTLGFKTTNDFSFTNNPESQAGLQLLEDAGLVNVDPTDETVIVQSDSATVDDPAFQEQVTTVVNALRGMDGVVVPDSVVSYYELAANPQTAPAAQGMVSQDRKTLLIPVTLAGDIDEATENATKFHKDLDALAGEGFDLNSVGFVSIGAENAEISDEDIAQGESIGILAALVILVVVFAALVAAGLPIILGVVSIVSAMGITAIVSHMFDLSFFVTSMITMIGLAVGIDYALFVVERYREERRHGHPKSDAISIAGGTASKAVAFSGGTVMLALIGMFLFPASIFRSLALGAIIVVIMAVAATLTLIPALLGLLGDKIDWPRKRHYDDFARAHAGDTHYEVDAVYTGFWGRITKLVMSRPIVSVVLSVAVLLTLAFPFLDIDTGFAGVETMPEDSEARRGFEVLNSEFSAGRISPVMFAIEGDPEDTAGAIANLRTALAAETIPDGNGGTMPAFLPIPEGDWAQWNEAEGVGLLETTLAIPADDDRAYTLVVHLREDVVPAAFEGTDAEVYVTGDTAFNKDFFDIANEYAPIVIGFVLALSFLLLLLAFRSLVVSAKAILMNLLSVGAAYGLLVLVFQKGVGNGLFGFQQTPTIEAWIPVFLFCVLFGLSMDYHVFLLSRIREHYDQTGRNQESVAVGLHSTAKIITGAALIMVAVFGGFAAGRLVMMQQMGFGLGVAVLLDATIVRSILVPSAMALLGDRNWYLPKWLHWLPDLRVEGARTHVAAPPIEVVPVPTGTTGE